MAATNTIFSAANIPLKILFLRPDHDWSLILQYILFTLNNEKVVLDHCIPLIPVAATHQINCCHRNQVVSGSSNQPTAANAHAEKKAHYEINLASISIMIWPAVLWQRQQVASRQLHSNLTCECIVASSCQWILWHSRWLFVLHCQSQHSLSGSMQLQIISFRAVARSSVTSTGV